MVATSQLSINNNGISNVNSYFTLSAYKCPCFHKLWKVERRLEHVVELLKYFNDHGTRN